MSNKIFCTAPFTTLRIESYTETSPEQYKNLGVVFKPGCVYDPSQPIPSLNEYLNGAEMSMHRDNLSNGTIPRPNCHACSSPENLNLQSIRLDLLKKPWASDQKKIVMLDVLFSNVCNLGCIMCGPDWSSYAADERFKAGLITQPVRSKNNIPVALETMDKLPDLQSVSFIGGEFFVVKENSLLLDKIIKRKIGCSIFTNASVINNSMIKQLEQIKNLEMQISIDGTEDVYEFIRYPASWQTFSNNVKLLKEKLHWAKTHFSIVIQPLNIQNLHEVYEWNNKFIFKTHHQIITTPSHLSWPILNKQEVQKLIDLLQHKQQQKYLITKQQTDTIDSLIDALTQIEHSPELRKKFVKWLSTLLNYRKIKPNIIKKVLGVADDMAQEIILAMRQIS